MLNPGGKAQEVLKYPIFLGQQWQIVELMCSQTKKAQKNAGQKGEQKSETNVAERLQLVSLFL